MTRRAARTRMRGVTLVELMVAMLLGLLVVGAAMSVFLANKQTYVASENLGRMQESARVAFELMARDIREAATSNCGVDLSGAVNVVNAPTTSWYTDFGNGVRGYSGATAFSDAPFGLAAAQRVSGTSAIELKSAAPTGATVKKHNPVAAQLLLNDPDHGLAAGDLAVVCDPVHAAIFQVTNAQSGASPSLVHNTGSGSPGNCTKGLGLPLDCTSPVGTSYEFGCAFGGTDATLDCTLDENKWSAFVARLQALRWYVGCNGRAPCAGAAGRSLYRSRLDMAGALPVVEDDEIAEGVTDMSLAYLVDGAAGYVAATAVSDWQQVVAVQVDLELTSRDLVDGSQVQKHLEHVVALRSRTP